MLDVADMNDCFDNGEYQPPSFPDLDDNLGSSSLNLTKNYTYMFEKVGQVANVVNATAPQMAKRKQSIYDDYMDQNESLGNA